MRTLAKAEGAGIDRVSIVHDAFGTTPGKTGALAQLLREEFVKMYSEDIPGETLGRMLEDVGAVSPEVPPLGTLDLNRLRNVRHMFALPSASECALDLATIRQGCRKLDINEIRRELVDVPNESILTLLSVLRVLCEQNSRALRLGGRSQKLNRPWRRPSRGSAPHPHRDS